MLKGKDIKTLQPATLLNEALRLNRWDINRNSADLSHHPVRCCLGEGGSLDEYGRRINRLIKSYSI